MARHRPSARWPVCHRVNSASAVPIASEVGEAPVAEDDLPSADQVVAAFQQGGHQLACPMPGVG